jgi:NADH-quinone oxidoreductase subunit C
MVDFDVRLGLSPTDLTLRHAQVRRPDNWTELDPKDSPEMALVQQVFAGEIVKSRKFRDESTIWVRKERIVDICRLLRDHPDTLYNFLSDLTAVDLLKIMGPDDLRFEVVYNLYSLTTFKRLRIKAQVADEKPMPSIDTVESVWPAANWPEREVYDLFGISFNNHSDLRRIQMPDDWIGHPLRKDFPLGGETVEFSFNVSERSGGGTRG